MDHVPPVADKMVAVACNEIWGRCSICSGSPMESAPLHSPPSSQLHSACVVCHTHRAHKGCFGGLGGLGFDCGMLISLKFQYQMSALGCLLGWMGLISKLNGLPSISCIEMALVCSNLPQRFSGHNLAAHIDVLTAQVQFVLLQAPQSSVVVAEESVFSTVWTLHNIQMQEFVQRMSSALPQIVQQLFHVSSVLEPSRHLPLRKEHFVNFQNLVANLLSLVKISIGRGKQPGYTGLPWKAKNLGCNLLQPSQLAVTCSNYLSFHVSIQVAETNLLLLWLSHQLGDHWSCTFCIR